MSRNFPNLGRNLDMQVHETHRAPNKVNVKEILSKTYNTTVTNQDRERILKATRENKFVTYKGISEWV